MEALSVLREGLEARFHVNNEMVVQVLEDLIPSREKWFQVSAEGTCEVTRDFPRPQHNDGWVVAARFSPTGDLFLTSSVSDDESVLRKLDSATGECRPLHSRNLRTWMQVFGAAFHPDQTRWAVGGDESIQDRGHLAIFSVDTDAATFLPESVLPTETVHSLDFSVDGLLGVLNMSSFCVLKEDDHGDWSCLWRVRGDKSLPAQNVQGHELRFSPNGSLLACSASGLAMLSAIDGSPVWSKTGHYEGLCFSPDGDLLAACHDMGVTVFHATTGDVVSSGTFDDKGGNEYGSLFRSVDWSRDSDLLVTCTGFREGMRNENPLRAAVIWRAPVGASLTKSAARQ
mmetsp:Transcript_51928/g.112839  ORF Transcript_51928/g.112839 Transcript_51928/m.112839 type:complete len:342 (+) Transcript_51928:2-1027(+)